MWKPMNLIVAVDAKFGIAKNNNLPWHLPKEYAHFVKLTTETKREDCVNAVIMGRKCWESIPKKFRPLRKRINVILSRTMAPQISDDLVITSGLDEAIKLLTESELFKDRVETIWNIGGSEIYRLGLDHPTMHKLVLTRIEHDYDCDLRFPDVDWMRFTANDDFAEGPVEEKGVRWQVTSYTKKACITRFT